jgi:hypothetical protein
VNARQRHDGEDCDKMRGFWSTATGKNHDDSGGKKIVLGVSGGIAAYKTPELVRRLRERGADVRVAMTEAAKAFITPLSLQAVSGYPVSDSLLDPAAEAAMGHIELEMGRPGDPRPGHRRFNRPRGGRYGQRSGVDDLSRHPFPGCRRARHEPADVSRATTA